MIKWDRNRICCSEELPDNFRGRLAIWILQTSPEQHHLGLCYRSHKVGIIEYLHLEWHLRLSTDEPTESYLCIEPRINQRRLLNVAAFSRRVIKQSINDKIPYGFSFPTDCFDEQTGCCLLQSNGQGLTCASFVLAIFHSLQLPLVQYETWVEGREKDRDWQEFIVQQLEEHGASEEHVNAIRKDIGIVRFRPEDVAGAVVCETLPAHFETASQNGEKIKWLLNREGVP